MLAGCSGGNPLPGLVKLSGKVTYNGQPVGSGQVVFLPSTPGEGRQAVGLLGEDGAFTLTTLKKNDGVLPGDYDVLVVAYDKPPGEPSREEREALAGKPWRKPLVPTRYTNVDTTDLRESVTADHPGVVTFDLTDEPTP